MHVNNFVLNVASPHSNLNVWCTCFPNEALGCYIFPRKHCRRGMQSIIFIDVSLNLTVDWLSSLVCMIYPFGSSVWASKIHCCLIWRRHETRHQFSSDFTTGLIIIIYLLQISEPLTSGSNERSCLISSIWILSFLLFHLFGWCDGSLLNKLRKSIHRSFAKGVCCFGRLHHLVCDCALAPHRGLRGCIITINVIAPSIHLL